MAAAGCLRATRWTWVVGVAALARAAAAVPVPATHQVDVPWSTAGVLGVAVAPDGALWAAGQLGVFRFDGRDVAAYDARNTAAFAGAGQIVRIAVDHEGSVWASAGGGLPLVRADGVVTTEGDPARGLRRFRHGRWSVLGAADGFGDGRAWALLAHDRAIWIGTTAAVIVVRDGRPSTFGPTAALPPGPITVLAADGPGAVLAGNARGLCRLTARGCERLLDEPVLAALREPPSRVWAGTARGLVAIEGTAARRLGSRDGLAGDEVRALALDREGALWVATYTGLSRVHGDRIDVYRTDDGLPEDRIAALAVDREGGVWAGTRASGIARVSRAVVAGIGAREGLPGERARTVASDGRGGMWILTSDGLARCRAGGLEVWRRGRELPDDELRTMAAAPDGGVWVVTFGGALAQVSATGKVQAIQRAQGLPGDPVSMVLAGHDGSLWTSGRDRALTRWRIEGGSDAPMRLRALETQPVPGPCDGALVGGYEAPSGTRYFLPSGSGLVRARDGRVECLAGPLGLRRQPVSSAWEDQAGAVWLGASFDGGLVRLGAGRPHLFDEASGLPCDSITGIAADGKGHLWLACAGGVARVPLAELDAVAGGRLGRVSGLRFDAATGMRSQESGPGHGSVAALGPDGALWVATARGVSVIQAPEPLALPAPTVSIDDVRLDGRAAAAPFTTSAVAVDLELAYRAIAFTYPTAVRFRHRLAGLEQDWIYTDARLATYRRLPPGRYRFEVQAANAYGAWSQDAAAAPIVVRRPWHRSPWFAIAGLAGLAAIAVAGHRLRLERVRARFRLVQAERERMARDLHDGLGQGFTSIGFHLDALAEHVRGLPGPNGLLEETRLVLDQCREEARRAIWALRDDVLKGRSLEEGLGDLARAAGAPPAIEIAVTGRPAARDGFLEHELYRMATELVTNARKHAQAGHVVVELDWSQDEVVLRVKDDGRGFAGAPAEHAARGHFGLVGIRERARWLGGEVAVMSGAGVGTEVRVSAPLGRRRAT